MLQRFAGRAYKATLSLQNRAEAGIRQTEARLFSLTSKAYLVTIRAKDEVSGKIRNLKNSILGSTLGVTSDMMVGAGISYGLYDTIKTYKDFEAQMSTVGAISGATGADLEALTAKAKEMGAQTAFSATDAGKAFEYMAMAGWKQQDMIAGIEGIMNLAAASGEDLGRTSDIVTDALTAFGLQASDSAHFADVLAQASSNSNTNVSMMGETFKYVAPLAGALKYSVEDVGIAIGLMANSGIKASEAGTSLRSIFTRLISPPKQAAQALDQLGISVTNADGTVKPFRQTMRELRTAFSGLSDSEKTAMASSIAGQEAMSGFLAIVNASDADFDKLADSIDNAQGAAKRMADTRMDNLAGDLEQLGGAWETFQLSIMSGKGANFLRDFVQGVTKDVEKLNKYIQDGFDFSDIVRTAMDVITQLKNKFLELDGVGSVLAGGALIGGLAKITSMGLRAVDKLRDLSNFGKVPAKSGSTGSLVAGTGNVGSMVIHAQSVVVNGRNTSGGPLSGGETVPVPGGEAPMGGGKTKGGFKARAGRFIKGAAGIGTALTLGLAAYDLYDTKQSVDNDRLYAQNNLDEKREAYYKAIQNSRNSDGKLDMNSESVVNAGTDLARAYEYNSDVHDASEKTMNTAIGSTAGTVLGTIAGGALGSFLGPAGTMAGSMVGGTLGGMAGGFIGEHWSGIKDTVGGAADTAGGAISLAGEAVSSGLSSAGQAAGETFDWLTDSASEAVSGLGDVFSGIGDIISDSLSGVWQGISSAASAAWDYITSLISSAWDTITGIWGAASGWFQGTVWSPISSAVDAVRSAISNAFQSAYSFVTGLFGGLAGWFESNVIGPIKAKFDALKNFASGIVSRGAAITGLSAKANGGFVNGPTQALIGEAGPEVVIPLSPIRRNRAMDLLQRVQSMIMGDAPISGIGGSEKLENSTTNPFANVADFDNGSDSLADIAYSATAPTVRNDGVEEATTIPIVPAASAENNAGTTISVNLGGFAPTITIQTSNGADAEEILQVIRQNLGDLADDFAGRIAEVTGKIHANQAIETG